MAARRTTPSARGIHLIGVPLDLGGGRTDLRLGDVTDWRRACDQLASTMDAVVAVQLSALAGRAPW